MIHGECYRKINERDKIWGHGLFNQFNSHVLNFCMVDSAVRARDMWLTVTACMHDTIRGRNLQLFLSIYLLD